MTTIYKQGGKVLKKAGKICTTCCGRCPTETETEDGTSLPRPLNITVAGFCAACSCQALNFGPQQIISAGASTAPVWDAGDGRAEYDGVDLGIPFGGDYWSGGNMQLSCRSGVWHCRIDMTWNDGLLTHDGLASFDGDLTVQSGIDPRGTYDGTWTITVIHGVVGDCTDTGVTVTIS